MNCDLRISKSSVLSVVVSKISTYKKRIYQGSFFFVFAAYIIAIILFSYAHTPVSVQEGKKQVIVNIPRGAGAIEIGGLFADAGLLSGGDIRFPIIALFMGVASELPAGEYKLTKGLSPINLINEYVVAKPEQYAVVIPEGFTLKEIAARFSSAGWCDEDKFLELSHDSSFINSLGVGKINSLEGYLYPATYYFNKHSHTNAQKIILLMVDKFEQVWQQEFSNLKNNFDRHETLILASIIEKETAAKIERSMISAVFINRLKQGMRLQSDPTVIYGIKNFNGNITKKNLKTFSPYNTYVLPALPAGPICNPGKESIKAVFMPDNVNYLYFVSKNDGSHKFSNTLAEHNKAVRYYQKNKKSR